jgi:enamine deaminase RidA (YjgF/YER057c/UK114 family)
MAHNDSAARLRDVVIPSNWIGFYEETGIPAAVWAGDTLRVGGHTGEGADDVFPADIGEQIRGVFRNLTVTLEAAGLHWSDVVEITSYHVDYQEQAELLFPIANDYLSVPFPAWTAVGVAELYLPEALIEISCIAYRGDPIT